MSLLIYFFVALVLSFVGSLPIGLITLTIIQKTIEKGKRSGVLISLGALVMEFGYTFLALKSLELFSKNIDLGSYIKIFATTLFLILGIYYFFKKPATELKKTKKYDYFDFLRGVIVGFMNVLILPYWIFVGMWLESNGMLFTNQTDILTFSIGATLGAFLAFLAYIWFSKLIKNKIQTINQYTNKVVGVLFIGLGIFQLVNLL